MANILKEFMSTTDPAVALPTDPTAETRTGGPLSFASSTVQVGSSRKSSRSRVPAASSSTAPPHSSSTIPNYSSAEALLEVRVDPSTVPRLSLDEGELTSVENGGDDSGRPPYTSSVTSKAISTSPHTEPHFGSAEIIRDVIVGLSDGLTVPFALAAGLASLNSSRLVVTAGLAEIVAGSISMGLGGYLAGMSEIEHYDSERLREKHEVETVPEREIQEIHEIFEPYGMNKSALEPLLNVLTNNKEAWVDFMMKFELNMERPDRYRAWISALTIGFSYLMGGLVPLIPYMAIENAATALYVSAGATILALFIFGYIKAKVLGVPSPLKSALQMALVGSVAAGAAFGIAKAIPPS